MTVLRYNFRPEVENYVISGVAVHNVCMDVLVKFDDSRSNGFRDIQGTDFMSNERTGPSTISIIKLSDLSKQNCHRHYIYLSRFGNYLNQQLQNLQTGRPDSLCILVSSYFQSAANRVNMLIRGIPDLVSSKSVMSENLDYEMRNLNL